MENERERKKRGVRVELKGDYNEKKCYFFWKKNSGVKNKMIYNYKD